MDSGTMVGWVALFAFFFLLAAAAAGEIAWLRRKNWTTAGKATGYVIATDLVSLAIGSVVALSAFFIMFMMVMGRSGTGGNSPEWLYWVVTAIGVLLPAIVLFFAKRLGLLIFGIQTGRSAWMYSLVSSVMMMLVVLIPPPLMYFLIAGLSQWKK